MFPIPSVVDEQKPPDVGAVFLEWFAFLPLPFGVFPLLFESGAGTFVSGQQFDEVVALPSGLLPEGNEFSCLRRSTS